jgi:FkbM family methyltransferase
VLVEEVMKKIKEYYIPENDQHFIKYLQQFDHYQEAQRNRALSHVFKWDLAIDIGANIGLWSKDLSNFFDKLICFEPNPYCVKYLKKNINLKNSEINCCALGSVNENKNLFIHPTNSGASSFINNTKIGYNNISGAIYGEFPSETEKVNVEIKNLDSFNIKNINFIKVDVQGYELDVLRGSVKTLERNDPILCIEEDNPQSSKTIPFLENLNYKIIDIINKEHIFKKKNNY